MKKVFFSKLIMIVFFTIACFSWVGCESSSDDDDKVYGVVRIANDDSNNRTISTVYISPTTSTTWGSNWLSGLITKGSYKDFVVEAGAYDIRVETIGNSFYAQIGDQTVVQDQTLTLTVTDTVAVTKSLELKEDCNTIGIE